MSILIKGMEMPTDCWNCPCYYNRLAYCNASHRRIETDDGERQRWCPLVHVPPHGRLIDADALIEQKEWTFDGVGQTEMVNVAEIVNANDNPNEDLERECCAFCPQTNADRIRAKTDEELAEWIYQVQDGDAYQKENYLNKLSKRYWLNWLKTEVKDGRDNA